MPMYKPFKIKNGRQYKLNKLSINVPCNLYSLFTLFFTNKVITKLIKQTSKKTHLPSFRTTISLVISDEKETHEADMAVKYIRYTYATISDVGMSI